MNLILWSLIILLTIGAWLLVAVPLLSAHRVRSSWLTASVLTLFPMMALVLYALSGNYSQLQQFWAERQMAQAVQQKMAAIKSPQQLINEMKAHLQQTPNSAEGWYLLGKLYLSVKNYRNAQAALAKACQLQPKNNQYAIDFADADFFNHGGHLSPAVESQLKNMLPSLSEPVEVLNLLAINAYRAAHYRQAVSYWQQALPLVQPDSPDSRALLDMIRSAQKKE